MLQGAVAEDRIEGLQQLPAHQGIGCNVAGPRLQALHALLRVLQLDGGEPCAQGSAQPLPGARARLQLSSALAPAQLTRLHDHLKEDQVGPGVGHQQNCGALHASQHLPWGQA